MSTRATIRFATREEGVTFNEHPKKWHAQFYRHHDGYPEGLGLALAYSIVKDGSWNAVDLEIEHVDVVHSDIEYMYYIWQDHGKSIWISIFEVEYGGLCDTCGQEIEDYGGRQVSKCIFVGTPEKLITKYGSQLDESYYKLNTNKDG